MLERDHVLQAQGAIVVDERDRELAAEPQPRRGEVRRIARRVQQPAGLLRAWFPDELTRASSSVAREVVSRWRALNVRLEHARHLATLVKPLVGFQVPVRAVLRLLVLNISSSRRGCAWSRRLSLFEVRAGE